MGTRIHQRGFLLPTWGIYLGLAAAALAALWWAYSVVDGRGYARGQSETEAAYLKRDNKALQDSLARVAALQAEIRAREADHATRIAAIAAERTREKADAQRQQDLDRAAVRAGTLQLRDPGAAPGGALCPGGQAGPAQPAAGGSDGDPGGRLSDQAGEFLLQLVNEADDVARQLGRAQQVIREQVRACNGP